MDRVAYAVAYLAFAGVVVSWLVGAWFYAETLLAISAAPDRKKLMSRAMFNWLFVARYLKGTASVHAAKVNKAIVAFFVCLTIAVAAFSVAINLERVSR